MTSLTFSGGESYFTPFTYDDFMKPLLLYKEVYDKVEQDYADLAQQTEAWADIANRENSPEAWEMYNRYSTALDQYVSDFSRNGLNITNRSGLLGMKKAYAQEITPIASAHEAMKEANNLRDNAGPDAVFEVSRYSSLDDFLHGKTANNKYESRAAITAKTEKMALAAALSIFEDPEIRDSMNPLFLLSVQKNGLGSLDELEAAIAGNPKAMNKFAQIKKDVIQQIGGLDRFDSEGLSKVNGAIDEGLYAGLNKYASQLHNNGEYVDKSSRISHAHSAAQLALSRQRLQWEKAKYQDAQDKAEGKKPLATDPDGTQHYTNGINTWTRAPQTVKVTKANREAIAKSRGVSADKIALGKTYYLYKDNKGNPYYGNSIGGYDLPDGGKATLQYGSPSAPVSATKKTGTETKPEKLGYTLSLSFDASGNNYSGLSMMSSDYEDGLEYAPEPITRGYDALSASEKAQIESRVPNVNEARNKYNYFYIYIDKNGDQTQKGATGKKAPVTRQLIIKDK